MSHDASPHHLDSSIDRLEYYDSLDAYRAFAMLGGVLLHGAMAYVEPEIRTWPVENWNGQIGFTIMLFVVHAFRLQAFFMMAGFFAGLLLERRGIKQFIWNRLKRVGLPLLLASVILVPLIQALFVWGYEQRGYGGDFQLGHVDVRMPDYYGPVTDFFLSGRFISGFLWFHLWFLWYLLWIYAIWLIGEHVWQFIRPFFKPERKNGDRRDNERFQPGKFWLLCLPLLLSVPTAVTMLPMRVWQADSPTRVMPQWSIVFYYLIFFLAGRWLYVHRTWLRSFQSISNPMLLMGIVVGPIMLAFQMVGPQSEDAYRPELQVPAILTYSVFSWLMILGLLGFFQKYFDRPRAALRYVAQSSYWQYLAHLPVIIVIQFWVNDWGWPNWAKYAFVCGATYLAMFASYHFLVRHGWLGILLNGRRYLSVKLD